MEDDKQLHLALKSLHLKTDGLEINDAIAQINIDISEIENPSWVPHFEVHKAALLRGAERISEAAELLQNIAARHSGIASASYFAGEYLLELGQYAQAITCFGNCLLVEEEREKHWFVNSARLLRAYCAAKINNQTLAINDLESIPENEEVSWLSTDAFVSKSSILSMLAKK
jgi:tetratricopeptide (TPR) repeat protein